MQMSRANSSSSSKDEDLFASGSGASPNLINSVTIKEPSSRLNSFLFFLLLYEVVRARFQSPKAVTRLLAN
jgi:hypothetical protein